MFIIDVIRIGIGSLRTTQERSQRKAAAAEATREQVLEEAWREKRAQIAREMERRKNGLPPRPIRSVREDMDARRRPRR